MIEMILSGFLFLFILVLNLAMGAFGYLMEKDDYDPDADLKNISSPYNMLLGIILLFFRIGEGLIQFINEPNYWSLIKLAKQYSDTSDADKNPISDLARNIFKTKDTRFKFAMICWSIGTLAFSIILVTSEIVPQIIGWLGVVSSILVGFGTGIKLLKPNFKGEVIGGLSAILFEVIIGGWLLFSPII